MLTRRLIRLARQQRIALATLLLSIAIAVLVCTVPVLHPWSRLSGWLALWGLVGSILLAAAGRRQRLPLAPMPHSFSTTPHLEALKSLYVAGESDQDEFDRRLTALIDLSTAQAE